MKKYGNKTQLRGDEIGVESNYFLESGIFLADNPFNHYDSKDYRFKTRAHRILRR